MRNPLLILRRRRRNEEDFREEIAAHLALETDRLVAEGRSREDAAYEARRRFGNLGLAREAFHFRRTVAWIEDLPRQLRRSVRRLVRAPVFAATAGVTLMVGIGATTAVFSLVDGVLLRPLPFARPQQLVDLSHTLAVQGISGVDQSDATYLYYRRANHVFSDVGAYRTASVNLGDAGTGDAAHAERVEATRASASVFRVLGITPLLGRVLRDDEDLPGAAVVVLGERLWARRYASDPGIVGRTVIVDGMAREVVGVVPRRFAFPDERSDLWLPVEIDPARTSSAVFDLRAVARLRPGVTAAAAAADLQTLLPHVPEAFPGRLTAPAIRLTRMRAVVRSLAETMVGGVGRALWVVFGAAALLLLIACANVANLFLVRAEERQHDLLVRRALGAGRGAIVAEFLAEGLVLSALGAVLGLALAVAGTGVLRALGSRIAIPRLDGVALDGPVLAVAAGVTLLAALATSVVPALRAFGSEGGAVLVETARGATPTRRRHRARRALVVVQMALALTLVCGAGLMVRTFRSLRSVPAGFDPSQATTLRVELPEAAYPTTGAVVGLVTQAINRLTTLPGVRAVGVVSKVPLDDEGRADTALFIPDRPVAMGAMPVVHQVVYATPGAFGALGIPLLQGRAFDRPDPARAPLEVIVTRALAKRYWADGPAVGRRVLLSPAGPEFTVVGVTGDVRGTRLDQSPDETVYLPLVTAPGPAEADGREAATRWTPRALAFVVRSAADPHEVAVAVQRTLAALAPAVPVYGVRTMAEVVARSTSRTAFTLELLEIASLAALLIGAVGLYGVVSYMVTLRSREIAVRIALGARPAAVRRQILIQAAPVVALGLALGVAVTLALTRLMTALLFGVAAADPATLLVAAALMSAVAAGASWIPARRAAAMDPARALRADV